MYSPRKSSRTTEEKALSFSATFARNPCRRVSSLQAEVTRRHIGNRPSWKKRRSMYNFGSWRKGLSHLRTEETRWEHSIARIQCPKLCSLRWIPSRLSRFINLGEAWNRCEAGVPETASRKLRRAEWPVSSADSPDELSPGDANNFLDRRTPPRARSTTYLRL